MSDHTHFRALVFEGGGAKGLCYGGAVNALEERKILANITHFAGTSAGAIVATLLAVGYTAHELNEILLHTNFRRFEDNDWGIFRDMVRLLDEYGWNKGDDLLMWIEAKITAKTHKHNFTFKDLFEGKGTHPKTLYIPVTNITAGRLEIMNHLTQPNLPISVAVRMSMSIPFVYRPYIYHGNQYVDGGLIYNYPINVFDSLFIDDVSRVVGLKLMGTDERRSTYISDTKHRASGLIDFALQTVGFITLSFERIQAQQPNYWRRTITVPSGNIGVLPDPITNDPVAMKAEKQTKEVAIHVAQIATQKALARYMVDGTFGDIPAVSTDPLGL